MKGALDEEMCNDRHSTQLGGDGTNDRIYVLHNKVYKWRLVSRELAIFTLARELGTSFRAQLLAAKKSRSYVKC